MQLAIAVNSPGKPADILVDLKFTFAHTELIPQLSAHVHFKL